MMYLSADFLTWLNCYMVITYGGLFTGEHDNVANRNSLDYVVEAVPGAMYGQELHPGVFRKAAVYAYHIIQDHVFRDGNKRTGMEAAFLFLRSNGHQVISATSKDIVDTALKVAQGHMSIDDLAKWLEAVCTPRNQ